MNLKGLLVILFLVAACAPLYAQNAPPDLSGTWQLNLAKSKLPKDSKVQSETISISCSPESVRMHYMTDGKESDETFVTDGKERTINENQGGKVVVKAKWRGPVLITETSARLKLPNDSLFNGSDVIHYKESWKLSADGRVLTVEHDEPRRVSVYEKTP